jgi:hypothetical protein
MQWTDWRGDKQTRTVNPLIDVRDFIGTPGFALLVLAANSTPPNRLSAPDIGSYLEIVGVGRSQSYLKKRRWLFQPGGTNNSANRDGNDGRAFRVMGAHPERSLRDLVVLLKERGIKRSKEWVRIHRLDAVRVATIAHK